MTYKLFIDDERFPVTDDWIVVRSSQEGINHIMASGMPVEISFDHDLGGDDTSMKFIWFMIDQLIDGKLTLPEEFCYSIHSQNPIGAANIKGLMDGFLADFGE